MPRATTTSDVFNAVAEAKRRDILSYLAGSERSVGEIADAMEMGQPSVSKHLKVLYEVGLVRRQRQGRRVLYSVDAEKIRPLYEWTEHLPAHVAQPARRRQGARRAAQPKGTNE